MDRFDDGKYFIINPDTRKVTVPVKYSSVIGDNGSQIFTFSIKRYVDGYDIMDCNDVTIHYDIISEENGSKLYSDVYQCDDLRVSETDENIVLVSWKLSKNATKFNGILSFTIKYSTTYVDEEEQVKETYVLQSRICEKLRIFTRVNNSQQIVEEYGDVLQQWKEDLERSKPTANVSKEGKEVTITITDKNGTTSSVVFDGASAYEIAVENGFEGSEEEWLESLKYTSSEEFQQLAEQVKQDAQTASNKAQEATTAATYADKYAKDAQASKEEANKSALSAAEAANSAGISASSAADSANTAKTNADKTNQDKTEVSSLVSGFDDHVAEKTTEFNQNVTEKTNAFDTKVVEANSTIDEKVSEATSQAEKAKEEADRATQATEGKLDKNQGAENSDKILTVDSDGNVVTKSKEDLGIIAKNDNFIYKDVGKSLNPSIDDSFKRELWNLKMYGKSTQLTTTGKNKFNPQLLSGGKFVEFNGVQCYKYVDGQNNFEFDFSGNTSNEQFTFTIKMYRESGSAITVMFFVYEDGTRSSQIVVTPNTLVSATSQSGKVLKKITGNYNNNLSVYIDLSCTQLELSSVATSYEPYTGGKPSPSSEYKQDVTAIEKFEGLLVGKNLFDLEKAKNKSNWIDAIKNKGYVNFFIKVKKGKQYTFSYNNKLTTGLVLYAGIVNSNDILNSDLTYWFYHSTSSGLIDESTTFVAVGDYISLRCNKDGIDRCLENLKELQLELGESRTEYIPCLSQYFTYQPTNPMYSTQDGSIADYVDVEKGVEVYNMKYLKITGDEDWHILKSGEQLNQLYFYLNDILHDAARINIASNIGKGILIGDRYSSFNTVYTITGGIGFNIANITIDEWREYLKSNEVYVIYVIKTPTEIPIDPIQLAILRALYTYNGITNFICNGEVSFAYEVSQQINNQKIWEAINANKLNIATK